MPLEETHEGLVLRSIDYRDRQKILTLYTPTRGVISLIVKGINRKKSHLLTLTSPLTIAEFQISIGKTDLYTFRDGTPLATNQLLRKNLTHLESAATILKALLTSQLPGKPSPLLYALTRAYLSYLPSSSDPAPLTASFFLKLLLHDGHLSPDYREAAFSPAEWDDLLPLLTARQFAALGPLSPLLAQKIAHLFLTKTTQ